MSKSVLVMDTPQTCLDCMFCFERNEGVDAHCSVVSGDEYSGFFRTIDCEDGYCQGKPDWCPLKELPEEEYYDGCDLWERGWNSDRNHLLKEILWRE